MPLASGVSIEAGHEAALLARHGEIEERLAEKQKSPFNNDLEIRALKKMKLLLKEEIEGIRSDEKN